MTTCKASSVAGAAPLLRASVALLLTQQVCSHSDTLDHPHLPPGTLNHPRDDRCTVRLRQLFPLGGPFLGNTAVTITGVAFQDLGDAKCRFGVDEVQARIVSDTTIECSSPGCASPTCIAGQQQTSLPVPLEVSMNGVSFTGSGLQFTYYDMSQVHVSLLTPAGGPNAGATRLQVHGVFFRDLTSGATGQRLQGLKCKFGANDMVAAKQCRCYERRRGVSRLATSRSTTPASVAPAVTSWTWRCALCRSSSPSTATTRPAR